MAWAKDVAVGIHGTGWQLKGGFAGAAVPVQPAWGFLKFHLVPLLDQSG
jgi:hypothetical protein